MPVYEYACTICKHHFDVEHGANEHPQITCPACGSPARKVFKPVPIVFKGSGWHVTDYGPTGPKSIQQSSKAGSKVESPEGKEAPTIDID